MNFDWENPFHSPSIYTFDQYRASVTENRLILLHRRREDNFSKIRKAQRLLIPIFEALLERTQDVFDLTSEDTQRLAKVEVTTRVVYRTEDNQHILIPQQSPEDDHAVIVPDTQASQPVIDYLFPNHQVEEVNSFSDNATLRPIRGYVTPSKIRIVYPRTLFKLMGYLEDLDGPIVDFGYRPKVQNNGPKEAVALMQIGLR